MVSLVRRCWLAYLFSPSPLSISLFSLPDPSNQLFLTPSLFRPFLEKLLDPKSFILKSQAQYQRLSRGGHGCLSNFMFRFENLS
jgi:hypothetical protein